MYILTIDNLPFIDCIEHETIREARIAKKALQQKLNASTFSNSKVAIHDTEDGGESPYIDD
jgi:hypothetical protein